MGGFFLGAVIVFVLGLNFFDLDPRRPAGDWRVSTGFFAGAAFCVIGAIWLLYRNRRIREAFFGGVLIGAALMGLMEGVCFSGR